MKVLIIVSFVLAAFVLIIINRLSKHPSKRDVKLEGNLLEETGSIEYEFQKQIRREKIEKVIRYTIAYLLLSIAAFFVIFPFYWMFATSVKSAQEVMKMPPTIIPQDPQFSNFAIAMQRANFSRYLVNTLIVAVFSTIGTLVTTVTSAFAFSRLSFKGRDLTFAIFIATMMIPGEMMVITNFITVTKTFKMYNTYFNIRSKIFFKKWRPPLWGRAPQSVQFKPDCRYPRPWYRSEHHLPPHHVQARHSSWQGSSCQDCRSSQDR